MAETDFVVTQTMLDAVGGVSLKLDYATPVVTATGSKTTFDNFRLKVERTGD